MVGQAPLTFGEWLTQRRKALRLSRAELGGRAGCSVAALRKIESGERRPSRQLAALLAAQVCAPGEDQESVVRAARGDLSVERLPQAEFIAKSNDAAEYPGSAQNRLPAQSQPIIGREAELASLGRLLTNPHCRLITLTGAGGMGKTRLALAVAERYHGLFRDGAVFIALDALEPGSFLAPAIAASLSLQLQSQPAPAAQLTQHLRHKEILLVLDNLEHLVTEAGLLSELLSRAPGVKLLTTSREQLSLQGEWIFEVSGLCTPPAECASPEGEYSAVTLFKECASRVRGGDPLKAEDEVWIGRICRLVEGNPLGIELAAAWLGVLTCKEIVQEIERSLDFLVSERRDAPQRQHSLRAAFDYSWRLLNASEQETLRRLAVFRGGFTRHAAQQIADAGLQVLSRLALKSLVKHDESGRYRLHEVIRQYAREGLEADSTTQEQRDRHARYYLTLLKERGGELMSASNQDALRELTEEISNVRSAWEWAVKREDFTSLGEAMRNYGWLCDIRGWLREGIEASDMVVRALREKTRTPALDVVLGQALAQGALLYFRLGEYEQARASFCESLELLRPGNDPNLLSLPMITYGVLMTLTGENDQAKALLEEGLANARAAGDRWAEALAIFNLGFAANKLGDHTGGYKQMGAALEIWRSLGDRRVIAMGLNIISPTAINWGSTDEAVSFLQESLKLCEEVGDRWGMGTALRNLGLAALVQRDFAQARSLLHSSLEVFGELEARWDVAQSLLYLGEATGGAGDPGTARTLIMEGLHLAVETGAQPLVLDGMLALAGLKAQAGESETAYALARNVAEHPASSAEAKEKAARMIAELTRLPTHPESSRAHPEPGDTPVEALLEAALGEEWLEELA